MLLLLKCPSQFLFCILFSVISTEKGKYETYTVVIISALMLINCILLVVFSFYCYVSYYFLFLFLTGITGL